MKELKIFFDVPKAFEPRNIRMLEGVMGLYFILLSHSELQYPFKPSRLIYIGMSEKRTNSIARRLSNHYDGKSKNPGLINYRRREPLLFTWIDFDMLKQIWPLRIEDLESYFILDFVEKYGVYPICNNKTGFEVLYHDPGVRLEINWTIFEKIPDNVTGND